MSNVSEKKMTPLLPYDVTFAEDFKMYDNFAYENDRDRTTPMLHSRETGNVLKYYTCAIDKDSFRIGIDTPKYLKITPRNKE